MNEGKNNVPAMYRGIPEAALQNQVPGFDPVKLLRPRKLRKTNQVVMKLDLPYKKLWFRRKYPKGRIRLNALRVTEQIAVYEAQVFLDRSDQEPVSRFTASCHADEPTVEDYIRAAQEEATDEALSMAGFDLQATDVRMTNAQKYSTGNVMVPAVPRTRNTEKKSQATENSGIPKEPNQPSVQTERPQPPLQVVANRPSVPEISGKQAMPAVNNRQQLQPAATNVQTARAQVQGAMQQKQTAGGQISIASGVAITRTQEETGQGTEVAPSDRASTPAGSKAPSGIRTPMQPATVSQRAVPQMGQILSAAQVQQKQSPVVKAEPVAEESKTEKMKLPTEETMEQTDLPVAPAMQPPTSVKEADTLPIPAAEVERPSTQAKDTLTNMTETQKAMQILQGSPVSVQKIPAQEAEIKSPEPMAVTPRYTRNTPVPEILKLMTLEEAKNVVVDTGICTGWTMEQVAERRAASLKYFLFGGYKGGNNILLAAAQIMLDDLEMKKAG